MYFVSEASTLLDDATKSPSKRYQGVFYPPTSEANVDTTEEDQGERPVLNSDRLRDLPPRDILMRAFHGYYLYNRVASGQCERRIFSFLFPVSEQPIQLDPRTPTFLLGVEQVIALVDATGKRVGNQVTSKLTEEKLFQGNLCFVRGLDFRFNTFLCICLFSSQIPTQKADSTLLV